MSQAKARVTLKRLVWPLFDFLRAYKIVLDGSFVGTIRRRQTKTFDVPPGEHHFHLEIDWCRSRDVVLDLAPGEEVRLACKSKVTTLYRISGGRDDYITVGVVGRAPAAVSGGS